MNQYYYWHLKKGQNNFEKCYIFYILTAFTPPTAKATDITPKNNSPVTQRPTLSNSTMGVPPTLAPSKATESTTTTSTTPTTTLTETRTPSTTATTPTTTTMQTTSKSIDQHIT